MSRFVDSSGVVHQRRPSAPARRTNPLMWKGLDILACAVMIDGVVHRLRDGLTDCGQPSNEGHLLMDIRCSDDLARWNRDHASDESLVTCLECLTVSRW